jgi:hypothetical protein
MLTNAQLQTLKADIEADPVFSTLPMTPDASFFIAEEYEKIAEPDYFVWRTDVQRAQIYHLTSSEGTSWNWTTYKNQGVAEQNAWTQMFMGDVANFALPNLRAGIGAIFTGSAQANAQRDHCLAIGKRRANRAEKLFAVGAGTLALPSTMGFEGALTYQEVEQARNL